MIGVFEKTTGLSVNVLSYIFFCSGMALVFLIFSAVMQMWFLWQSVC